MSRLVIAEKPSVAQSIALRAIRSVLDCGGFSAAGEKCAEKAAAQAVADACKGQPALVQTVEQKEKSEKPPALYDLTALQRDANRQLGMPTGTWLHGPETWTISRHCMKRSSALIPAPTAGI